MIERLHFRDLLEKLVTFIVLLLGMTRLRLSREQIGNRLYMMNKKNMGLCLSCFNIQLLKYPTLFGEHNKVEYRGFSAASSYLCSSNFKALKKSFGRKVNSNFGCNILRTPFQMGIINSLYNYGNTRSFMYDLHPILYSLMLQYRNL